MGKGKRHATRSLVLVTLFFLTLATERSLATENNAPSPASAVAATKRTLSDQQKYVIKHVVLRLAKASIISERGGEPEQFAHELELALRDAGAWVAIDKSNSVQSGQTGLIVMYDHGVPADASVFLALKRAGLNPVDHNIPGAPVATIIVGPVASRL